MFSIFKSKKNANEKDSTQVETESVSFTDKIRRGLARTRQQLGKQLSGLFGGRKIDDDLYEELETALLTA
ncbi:signal recognition particle receptor subunit alpha, partial [Nitrosomonas sp.]|uniref:signal recognition particle receptor subunit alpha n=1 Tax=Nitrosomonas sp. TaxID=42353 RepID=UPI0034242CD1